MPGSKYERELKFINTETRRLGRCLQELREMMPVDPVEAARKADEVLGIEGKIGELLRRKREIEDSFIAAGMDVPDVGRNLNANVYMDGPAFEAPPRQAPAAEVRPEGSVEDLMAEIESITGELMGIEIKMLRTNMNDDEDKKQELSMIASSLRSRRDTLVERVKGMRAEAERVPKPEPVPVDCSELQGRIETLETDAKALRSQISSVRTDVGELKEMLRQIKKALSIDD